MPVSSQNDSDFRHSNGDEACRKLWQVYLREAEEYDQGLVRSWKEDMDVALVFSGLYSAVLTAFVIESYKNLQPDQTELSTNLLLHISEQLANPSAVTAASTPTFHLKSSDIACNILWFLSLILALTCALLATFVQQWTRHFLHRATILRAPAARARLIAFLYFGLKDFKMHTIVDIIPSLLHLSLFSFFGGLVAFLTPINPVLQWLTTGLLVIITLVYGAFTLMPLINLKSPYHTPLSPFLWRTWKSLWLIVGKAAGFLRSRGIFGIETSRREILPTSTSQQYNLTSAMVTASRQMTQERDVRSIGWTLRVLSNDTELLNFVEALPNVIYGAGGKLHVDNIHMIKPLLETTDPDKDIISRTISLLHNSREFWAQGDHSERCNNAIPDVLWAIAYLLNRCPTSFDLTTTGRSSWFTQEQLSIVERYTRFLVKGWDVSLVNLIKSNMLLCKQSYSIPIAKWDPDITSDTPEQAMITLHYLRESVDALPDYIGMVTSTFHALKGHGSAMQLDTSLHYDILHQKLDSSVLGDPEDKESDFSENLNLWDVVFCNLLQICSKEQVSNACRSLVRRLEYPIGPAHATVGPWLSDCDRGTNRDPLYLPFLHAVIARGEYDPDCVTSLRSIIWFFDEYAEISLNYVEPQWWTRFEPLWLELLAQLEASDSKGKASHTCLAIMIKTMVLKKTSPIPSASDDSDAFDLVGFITKHIGSSLPTAGPSQLTQVIQTGKIMLIIKTIDAIDQSDENSFTAAEDTLAFIECDNLLGTGYKVDSQVAYQLAHQTRACSELWTSKSHSPDLLRILGHIWKLWNVDGISSLGPEGSDLFPLPVEVATELEKAAEIVIAQAAVSNKVKSTVLETSTVDATSDDGSEEEERASAGVENDIDSEGSDSSSANSQGNVQELVDLVERIRGRW